MVSVVEPSQTTQFSNVLQPFTVFFLYADIHTLLSPDILHQIIKGTFKDHLVTWIEDYINAMHDRAEAARILADIDRRCVFLFD